MRGATSVAHDTAEAILETTTELLAEVLTRNALAADDLISIIEVIDKNGKLYGQLIIE